MMRLSKNNRAETRRAGLFGDSLCAVLLLLAALGLVFGACSDTKKPKRPPPKKAAKSKDMDVQAHALRQETSVVSTYIYSPVGKRDPFRSLFKERAGKRKGDTVTSPLQQFEIDQLTLIAVITGVSNPRAMVVVPGGKGYTVKVGTRLGKNYGRIVRIKSDEVVIAEDYRDWNGRKVTNYIHMTLEKEEDAKKG